MQDASAADDDFGQEQAPTQSRRQTRGYVLPMDYANPSSGEGQPRRRRRRRHRSRYGAVETFFAFSAVWVVFVAALVLAEAMADLDLFFIREISAPILDKHGWLVGSNIVAQEGGMAAISKSAGSADQATAPLLLEESQSEIIWGRVVAVVLVVPLVPSIVRTVRRQRRR